MKKQPLVISKSFIEKVIEPNREDCKVCAALLKMTKHSMINVFSSELNYLHLRENGNISYCPRGVEQGFLENGTWKIEKRQESRPTKTIKKVFHKRALKLFSDKDLENFGLRCLQVKKELEFKLMHCSLIPSVYDGQRKNSYTLGESCMNGRGRYMNMYKNNVCVQIATLWDGEELAARALVWETDKGFFMDRVYACDHATELKLLEIGQKNQWITRVEQSRQAKMWVILPDGQKKERFKMVVKLDTDWDEFPYMDTFSYLADGYITNDDDDKNVSKELDCTGGGYSDIENSNRITNPITGERLRRDDCSLVQRGRYEGEYLPDGQTVECSGYTYWEDDEDIFWCESCQEYCHVDNGTYCDETEDMRYYNYVVTATFGTWRGMDILSKNANYFGDEVVHDEDLEAYGEERGNEEEEEGEEN